MLNFCNLFSNLFSILFQHFKVKSKNDEDLGEIMLRGPKQFTFETIFSATEGFRDDHKLGEGSFGSVYKGKLEDGREIAVKQRLQTSQQGKKEFMNEANMLGSLQHRNVVNFLGYCSGSEHMLLVYEYAVNGSLDKLLFDPETGRADALDWKRTYDIIMDIARGLHYLHEELDSAIIHSDIKPANILIDENWVPKIADFGTSRHFPQDQTHVNVSAAAGTRGYMAPEYMNSGQFSPKTDIFSFGVTVLELISSKKNWSRSDDENLLVRARRLYHERKLLEFMDPKLTSSAVPDQVKLCVRIGVLCTRSNPRRRPTTGHVISMLLGFRELPISEQAPPPVGANSAICILPQQVPIGNSVQNSIPIQVSAAQRQLLDHQQPGKTTSSNTSARQSPQLASSIITKQINEVAKKPKSSPEPDNKKPPPPPKPRPPEEVPGDRPINTVGRVDSLESETTFGLAKALFLSIDKKFKTALQSSISMSLRTMLAVSLLIILVLLLLYAHSMQRIMVDKERLKNALLEESVQKIMMDKERLENALLEKTRLVDEAERALLAAQKKAADTENFAHAGLVWFFDCFTNFFKHLLFSVFLVYFFSYLFRFYF